MVWLHYSKKSIDNLLDDTYCERQILTYKPDGLWLSRDTAWKDWMEREMPEWLSEVKYTYQVTFKKSARILKINNFDKLKRFNKKYIKENRETICFDKVCGENKSFFIDWKKVCRDYDGICFLNVWKIINEYDSKMKWGSSLFWWKTLDIDSMCIWRPSKSVSRFKPIQL
jgi:hypothetical protein